VAIRTHCVHRYFYSFGKIFHCVHLLSADSRIIYRGGLKVMLLTLGSHKAV